ncbi:tetratricopeptide repeat protein [Tateyamaria pelophila]|uniref:tetratricopeptide repeat protein n=1 Tax=Tateyamaria pelophila TaxID=328415 RepID=UPI001CC125F6|nr:tetratricopeptide repeat protein [Tateyamaria pelophila]
MVEKVVHGVNVAACCGQLVTQAVDIASTGGVATAMSATLSALALRPSARTDMERDCLTALTNHLEAAALHPNIEKQIVLMLDSFLPGRTDFASGDMNAASVAAHMRKRVQDESNVPEYRETAVLDAYEALLRATLSPLLPPRTQSEANDAELLARSTQHDNKLSKLMDMVEAQGADTRLHAAGITPQAITQLAARISAKTDDLGQAWRDLENAMEIAVKVQAEGHMRSNHGDFVDTVLARVAELSATGDYASANAAIDAALEDAEAAKARLLESGVNIAKLAGDIERAARLLIAQADHAAGGLATFQALRTLWKEYYERGRDRGVTLDSELAIALANHVHNRATTSDERGTALNDLGAALRTLGERESDTDRLDAAVTAYENALLQWTRDRVPLDWAMTQMNLGTALKTLGERESGTDRLDAAVTAYENALLERTREKVPLDWAMTQNNLGAALRTLGERESGTDRLDAAVTAFENALLEWTREKAPLNWATTQNNLGNALQTLGERESGPDRLDAAVTAYENALLERTREKVPLQWARTQNNLGAVLQTLGERESGPDRLDAAVTAYENALLERTREKVPLDWAMVQGNLANVSIAFFGKTKDASHLEQARAYVNAAREVYVDAGADHYIGITDRILTKIANREATL